MTSKGQVTLPAAFRADFGFQEGQRFDVRKSGGAILFVPQIGWDEFFANTHDFGEKARKMIKNGEASILLTNADIDKAASEGRQRGY